MARTLLIVDDSKTIREVIKVYLMNEKLTILEAETGVRGLQLVRLMPVDLVIADIKMPEMDGIEFTRALRAEPDARVKKTPVVLLTGEAGDDLMKQGMAAGAEAFLRKPVRPAPILELINRLMPPKPA
jgi:two-component system, chemotaxis family, chemotaxis protein CheY